MEMVEMGKGGKVVVDAKDGGGGESALVMKKSSYGAVGEEATVVAVKGIIKSRSADLYTPDDEAFDAGEVRLDVVHLPPGTSGGSGAVVSPRQQVNESEFSRPLSKRIKSKKTLHTIDRKLATISTALFWWALSLIALYCIAASEIVYAIDVKRTVDTTVIITFEICAVGFQFVASAGWINVLGLLILPESAVPLH